MQICFKIQNRLKRRIAEKGHRMKDKRIIIRISNSDYQQFKKKCKFYEVTQSAFLRSCIKRLINKNPKEEFQLKEQLCDKFRFAKALNEHALENFARQIRYVGTNINQQTRAINIIKKSPNLSQFQINELEKYTKEGQECLKD